MRHGERSFQRFSTSMAHAGALSAWHTLQALGILSASVSAGALALSPGGRQLSPPRKHRSCQRCEGIGGPCHQIPAKYEAPQVFAHTAMICLDMTTPDGVGGAVQ